MEELMPRTSSHSGNKPITYKYGGYQLEILPYFLYEISIYESHKDRFNILDSKMYTSNKLLKIKKEREVLQRTKEYEIIRFVDLLGAPESFIKDNNLPIYELNSKRKKNEKRKN